MSDPTTRPPCVSDLLAHVSELVSSGTVVLNGIPVVVTLTQNRGWGELKLATARGEWLHARVMSPLLRHLEGGDVDNVTDGAELGSQMEGGGAVTVGAAEDGAECLRSAVDAATAASTSEWVLDSGGVEKPEQRSASVSSGEFPADRPNGVNVDLSGQHGCADDQPPIGTDSNFGAGRHENCVELSRRGQVPVGHSASPCSDGVGTQSVGDGCDSAAHVAAESDTTGGAR